MMEGPDYYFQIRKYGVLENYVAPSFLFITFPSILVLISYPEATFLSELKNGISHLVKLRRTSTLSFQSTVICTSLRS